MLVDALAYAARGWRVQPLHNIENGHCTCKPSPNRPKAGTQCPTPGKHPRIKTGRAFEAATTDEIQIRKWWARWPRANIGIATGALTRISVVDVDGEDGARLLASIAQANGGMPATLMSKSGRDGFGVHFWFDNSGQPTPSNSGSHLDIRGDGGNLVAPPSMHVSGRPYAWINPGTAPAPLPVWLLHWFNNRPDAPARGERAAAAKPGVDLPAHLQGRTGARLLARNEPVELTPIADIEAALEAIPNERLSWDAWNRVGMAVWRACGGSDDGADAFDYWSQKSPKYDPDAADERWRAYAGSPPVEIGFGTLFFMAREANPSFMAPTNKRTETVPFEMRAIPTAYAAQTLNDRTEPKQANGHSLNGHGLNGHHINTMPELAPILVPKEPINPLAELNEKYAVIGDVGGKCLVLGWVASKVDPKIKIPSFQSFKSFSERYAARYVNVQVEKTDRSGNVTVEEEAKQLGPYWLKWTGRKNFEGIDLLPKAEPVLEGNILNMWSGFAVEPKAGDWSLMQRHITEVLADNEPESAQYILRWGAWTLQNPDKQAEVAIVLRGDKGSGKGTFAHALRNIFGHHGMYVSSSKHMVGQFNSHLRNCILLFADEAFWAGDKQGESVLKGMLTEPVLMIEQKGIDASPWRNLLHVIMAANAEWVIPASHDERRFAVFNVSARYAESSDGPSQSRARAYHTALRREMAAGGLAAMLHDLLALDLDGWHPRDVVKTEALREQKIRSMDARFEWLEGLLQDGRIPGAGEHPDRAPVAALLSAAVDETPKLRDLSRVGMGRFLRQMGCTQLHASNGNSWRFPDLGQARALWERRFGPWKWSEANEWRGRRV